MTDLSVDERKAMALGFLSMAKLLKPGVYYMAGFKQGREYSKQREEKLREGLRTAIRLLDADVFDRVEIEPLRALAENGDSDESPFARHPLEDAPGSVPIRVDTVPDGLGDRRPGA